MVDYCFVSHDDLSCFTEFNVIRTSELVQTMEITPTSLPDHSVLSWKINISEQVDVPVQPELHNDKQSSFKFDVSNIPVDFLTGDDINQQVHNYVFELERGLRTQNDIDNCYSKLCDVINHEMSDKLRKKRIATDGISSNKRRRTGKHGGVMS